MGELFHIQNFITSCKKILVITVNFDVKINLILLTGYSIILNSKWNSFYQYKKIYSAMQRPFLLSVSDINVGSLIFNKIRTVYGKVSIYCFYNNYRMLVLITKRWLRVLMIKERSLHKSKNTRMLTVLINTRFIWATSRKSRMYYL